MKLNIDQDNRLTMGQCKLRARHKSEEFHQRCAPWWTLAAIAAGVWMVKTITEGL